MVQKNEKTKEKKSVSKEKADVLTAKKKKAPSAKPSVGKEEMPKTAEIVAESAKKEIQAKKKSVTISSKKPTSAKAQGEAVKEKIVRKAKVKEVKPSQSPKIAAEKPAAKLKGLGAVKHIKEEKIKTAQEPPKKHIPAEKETVKETTTAKHKKHEAPVIEPPVVEPAKKIISRTEPIAEKPPEIKIFKGEIKVNELTSVRDLAEKMRQKPGDLLKKLLSLGSLATINQRLDMDTTSLIAHEFDYEIKFESILSEKELVEKEEDPSKLKPRSPVVTIMGHVDHGKTSLLDAIRESRVAEGEAGGITQHIGAYKVKSKDGEIAFLDTPGHEAFTAMRSRGAQATDLVVLVVSAADGVMPQTVEAIDHARAASVPIIVAINKIDLPTANPEQVKQELTKYNLMPEGWGGDTIMVEVSAKNKINIDQLLEMILLKAQMMELKANPDKLARGVVIEARLDSRRGPVATVLVQTGTLHVGDNFVVGTTYGKVRAMADEHGQRLNEAGPSTPVEILGINMPPQAGDKFVVVAFESLAKDLADSRYAKAREESLRPRHHLSLEDISSGRVKELRVIMKADVQGSLGALSDSIERLSTSEINLKIIHRGAGSITESDVALAAASDAMIIGFNIKPDTSVERLAEKEGVSIRVYRIIYELISDVKAAMEGLLEPQIKEISFGRAQVKQVFKASKMGTVAGSSVLEGKIHRGNKVRLLRDNKIIYEGNIVSLRRFKEDVKEVEKGYECGIGLENFSDIKAGDILEAYGQEKIARKL